MMVDERDDLNPRNRGLGRGLDAIFGEDVPPSSTDVSRETSEEINDDLSANDIIGDDLKRRTMPVEWLRPCAFQPRKHFNQDALEDLAKSIGMHGILQPIVVRPIEDENNVYEIIAGERRWRAAQMVQLHEVPVTLQYLDDEAVLEIALIENLQREDLTPIEEAKALQKLMDDYNHTQEKLSVTIGKSRSAIANTLRLLQLPESVQEMVNTGKLSSGHARNLVGHENAEEIAMQIFNDSLSVRDVESLMKKGDNASKPKPKKDKGVNTRALEEEMERLLGMKVTINSAAKKGAGSVKIDYKSLDQLDELLHRLSKH
jgi:ParB family chromosome partitioning protein